MAELIWKGKRHIQQSLDELQALANQLQTREIIDPQHDQYRPEERLSLANGWRNRLICGDNRQILPAMLPEFAEKVNLIYIDPPFMTGRDFHVGSKLAYSDKWNNTPDRYLQWLYEILLLLHHLLAPDGSMYVHLDWRVTHYARVLLDEIFACPPNHKGSGFKSEIIWHYESGGRPRKGYARKHDTILLYSRSENYCFHNERIAERRGSYKRNHMRKQVDEDGRVTWSIHAAGKLYTYAEDSLMSVSDVWSDISHLQQKDPERNGYATQKPAALLERIILASSEENDLILDCFCGSGVTPAVAEHLCRRWIVSDQSPLAIETTRQRLLGMERVHPFVLQSMR